MLSPTAQYLVFEFTDFWSALKAAREADRVGEWIIHRVREEWVPWWMGLPSERQQQICDALASLKETESERLLEALRAAIETDCETIAIPPNGEGAGEWVFRQLAHVDPFESRRLFERYRFDRVAGFKALCLHPDSALPVICSLLRCGSGPAHYEYNVRLIDAAGVTNAIAAVGRLLRGAPFFFNGRSRGIAHHPLALRGPVIASLVIGPLCIAGIYLSAASGRLSDGLLVNLLHAIYLSSALFLLFWLIAVVSDWLTERWLASELTNSQVAWGFGGVLPGPRSRNSLNVKGESFSAALALGILRSLAMRFATTSCWILWWVRRAERNIGTLGITGDISPTARIVDVDGFGSQNGGKKRICIRDGLIMLTPDQREALPTTEEVAAGLRVRRCSTLQNMIWSAATDRSGFIAKHRASVLLWLAAVLAVVIVAFSIFTWDLVFPPAPPDLDVSHQPIIEDREHRTQHLVLHFRTRCPECFFVRLHSSFWKTAGDEHLSGAKGTDTAVLEMELEPRDDASGNPMDSYVEILRTRSLPFLRLSAASIEEITFARLKDMYERSRGMGKYAYPNH